MARRKKFYTIGYEQTPAKAVLDELEQAGVQRLVRKPIEPAQFFPLLAAYLKAA